MAAANDARVDTTFIGYFLIGFVFLLFGVFGLQEGGLFGETTLENYQDMPLDWAVLGQICGIIGLVMILLGIFAYRTGKKGAAGIFAFTALFGIFLYFNFTGKTGISALTANSNWFVFIAFAIFFLIFAIYALIGKAPKFVALFLLLVALFAFFIGLACFYGPFGSNDANIHEALSIVYGIFAFLIFIIATYLGLAYANPKKIPLI